jgi:hemerythrin-like domain-containing protein
MSGGDRMLPVGPLMIEHRLIERMIALIKQEVDRIEREKDIHAGLLETAIDFIRTYVDRCHHGKEEEILYRELDKKALSNEHRRILEEILDEHRQSRKALAELEDANGQFFKGDRGSLSRIISSIRFLVDLYPRHIDKEDRHFFLPCMAYFSQEEKDAMLAREHEFDRDLFHKLYKERVENEEARHR